MRCGVSVGCGGGRQTGPHDARLAPGLPRAWLACDAPQGLGNEGSCRPTYGAGRRGCGMHGKRSDEPAGWVSERTSGHEAVVCPDNSRPSRQALSAFELFTGHASTAGNVRGLVSPMDLSSLELPDPPPMKFTVSCSGLEARRLPRSLDPGTGRRSPVGRIPGCLNREGAGTQADELDEQGEQGRLREGGFHHAVSGPSEHRTGRGREARTQHVGHRYGTDAAGEEMEGEGGGHGVSEDAWVPGSNGGCCPFVVAAQHRSAESPGRH